MPDVSVKHLLDEAKDKATPQSVFSRHLQARLLAALLPAKTAARRVAELSRKQRDAIADALHRHTIVPARSEGLGKAEAASGGVATKDVDPMTMQSRITPGLFFCGEILDITGRLGGYNLHWAFVSGTAAGVTASLHQT
jgi:predicted flavoprotein YhiN